MSSYLHAGRINGGLAVQPDPIVEEVRQAREEYAKQFDYAPHAMAADLRKSEQQHPERIMTFPSRHPRQEKSSAG